MSEVANNSRVILEEHMDAVNKNRAKLQALYGENKRITDSNYDKALAVRCVNGTFVGKETDSIIAYKGIPFTGKPPIGELRWKAPVDVVADDGVYEAYYNAKCARQMMSDTETASLYYQSEALTLNTTG